jgi:hypothetical protein
MCNKKSVALRGVARDFDFGVEMSRATILNPDRKDLRRQRYLE